MATSHKRDIHKLQLRVGSTHGWVKNLSGLFSLAPAHIKFVAMMVAVMERDGKNKLDTAVREEMRRIHHVKNMRGIYVIIGRLRDVGVLDKKGKLHPLLDFVNGKEKLNTKQITIQFERKE